MEGVFSCRSGLYFGPQPVTGIGPTTDNAAALALYHNHPSGSAEPSLQDCDLTAKLKGLLEQLDIRLVDHIVVASGTCVSMAARELV